MPPEITAFAHVWNGSKWGPMTQPGDGAAAGPLVPLAPIGVSVGTTSGAVLAENLNRTGLVLVNVSANRISLGLGATAVLDKGITLMPGGGTWTMDAMTFTTAAVTAIASGASSQLAGQEFT